MNFKRIVTWTFTIWHLFDKYKAKNKKRRQTCLESSTKWVEVWTRVHVHYSQSLYAKGIIKSKIKQFVVTGFINMTQTVSMTGRAKEKSTALSGKVISNSQCSKQKIGRIVTCLGMIEVLWGLSRGWMMTFYSSSATLRGPWYTKIRITKGCAGNLWENCCNHLWYSMDINER